MKRQLEGTSQEKTELTGRLKELTAKIREMTDDMENSNVRKWKILWKTEEFKVEKAVLTKELTKMKEDLNKYGKEIEKLNKLLDQRYDKPCFAFKNYFTSFFQKWKIMLWKEGILVAIFPILSSNQKVFRPSEDDVKVLRTELVNAQKLMDEISKGKDVEIQEHIDTIRKLNIEREKWEHIFSWK